MKTEIGKEIQLDIDKKLMSHSKFMIDNDKEKIHISCDEFKDFIFRSIVEICESDEDKQNIIDDCVELSQLSLSIDTAEFYYI